MDWQLETGMLSVQ